MGLRHIHQDICKQLLSQFVHTQHWRHRDSSNRDSGYIERMGHPKNKIKNPILFLSCFGQVWGKFIGNFEGNMGEFFGNFWVSFCVQLAAEKITSFLVGISNKFRPFYFVRALQLYNFCIQKEIHTFQFTKGTNINKKYPKICFFRLIWRRNSKNCDICKKIFYTGFPKASSN